MSEVAARVLVEPGHAGRTYTLTGPAAISVPEQAAVLAEALGRPVTTREPSADESRDFLGAWGLGDEAVEAILAGNAHVRRGRNEVVTDDVRTVLGRPARGYREWAEDHREAFGR
ncbi:hypothetical protein [Streptomyces sp. NPDC053367]|uniref:hypothetical protein n=1 Tax=Streptomyces sp. NPDC053367 TaxID=3365700 RepID=UPI0037CF0FA3